MHAMGRPHQGRAAAQQKPEHPEELRERALVLTTIPPNCTGMGEIADGRAYTRGP